jgi:hypothetical protein
MSPPTPLWKCLDIAICHGFYIEKYSNFGLLHSYCLTFKRGRGEGYIFFSLEPYIFFMQYLKSDYFFCRTWTICNFSSNLSKFLFEKLQGHIEKTGKSKSLVITKQILFLAKQFTDQNVNLITSNNCKHPIGRLS